MKPTPWEAFSDTLIVLGVGQLRLKLFDGQVGISPPHSAIPC